MTTTMQVTRRTLPPDPQQQRQLCEATTAHARYSAEKCASGWLCSVRAAEGSGVTLFAGTSADLLAEPYASELKAFAAACEASE